MSYTPEQLAAWKHQYGVVYSVATAGQEFIIRRITYAEYKVIRNEEESTPEIEEDLVRIVLLYPPDPDFDRMSAGVFTRLAEEVLTLSGFADPAYARQLLDQKRSQAQDVFSLMKAMVLATMPAYKEEELEAITFDDLVGKVVMAEKIIEVQQAIMSGGGVTLELVDPEEEAKKKAKERTKHALTKRPGTAGMDDPIARQLHEALRGG